MSIWARRTAPRHLPIPPFLPPAPPGRAGGGARGDGAAPGGAAAARPERLEGTRLDFPGVVAPGRVDAVVAVVEHEGVVQAFGGEEALLLGHPFLQPAVRHDLE